MLLETTKVKPGPDKCSGNRKVEGRDEATEL
jgi:hypothetical protein